MNDGSSGLGSIEAQGEALAGLVASSPFGIYIIDADFRIALVSVGARPVFAGVEPLIGRDLGEALRTLWPEPFATEAIGRFRHTLVTGEPYRSRDTVQRRQDIDAVESYDWQTDRLKMPDGRFGVVCHFYDNSTQLHVELALRENNQRLTSALNGSPAFMGILRGERHVYEYVNDAVYDLVGRRELLGKPLVEAIPEIAGQGYLEMLNGVYTTGKPYIGKNVPAWFARRAGAEPEQRFVDFAYQPLRGRDGVVDGIFFHGVDVTDRVNDERRVRVSEERYRALVTASSDVAYGMSADWSVMLALDGRGLVASNIEPIRDWLTRNIFPDDHVIVREAIATAIAGKTVFQLEHRVVRPDGSTGWAASRAVPLLDESGNITEWFGTASDITDRKRAEAALRESEERFRHAAAAASDILWTNTADGKMRGEQPGWSAFTGQSREECEGYGWAKAVHPDDAQATIAAWEEAVREKRVFEFEHRVRRRDGEFRACTLRAVPVLNDDGSIREWVGVHTDVTEKRRDERLREELLKSERAARLEAERAGRMKDEFLATLSHEIRTPLNAILGWSQIMRGSKDPQDLETGLEVIERNALSQSQIVQDLLDMSGIISGKVRLEVRQVDLAGIVQTAIETARPTAEAKGVKLRSSVDPLRGVPVCGDSNRLQQILWNLLSNSIKFTSRGGEVEVLLQRVDSALEISVVDTGEGIEAGFLPFVFDRFRQADSSTTRRHGGLGLGLSIVKQLVELHGGTVRVRSEGQGRGSMFTVALPTMAICEEELGARSGTEPSAASRGTTVAEGADLAGIRVLVVDDELDARQLIERVLENGHAMVTTAASAEEAMRALERGGVDVLLSDIGMPGEDGYSLIKRVRRLEEAGGRKIPAVALTAYARADDRGRAIAAGFLTHLAKPVAPADLVAAVAAAVGRGGPSEG